MNWLVNNPLGAALVSACGLIVLVSAGLAYVWSKPASSGAPVDDTSAQTTGETKQLFSELAPISEYREVTERPVFNESRRPALAVDGEGLNMDDMAEVADAPDVRLTGVIITPDAKLVTLRPSSSAESMIAHEGEPLEGDYFGWTVTDIKPRSVVLASMDGDHLELDLQVNTRRIEAPPEPVPVSAEENDGTRSDGESRQDSDEQPLSRAEEIRQRIAERREGLRRQAEDDQHANRSNKSRRSNGSGPSAYQSAIQNMINRNSRKDEEDEDDDDDEEKNGE